MFNNDYTRSRNSWYSSFEDILKELSLGDVFGNKTAINCYEMIKLADMYEEQSWRTRCMATPKLRTYITHKEQLDPEKYVTCHLSRKERSYLAQLRLGILPIKLEHWSL